MADRAIHRERSLHVVRISRAVVIRHMAQIAGAAGQVVVVVHVALRALQIRVAVRQGEAHRIVVERRLQPRNRVVTGLARSWESRRSVIRVVRAVVIRHVTQIAGATGEVVVVVDVALRALQVRVAIRQRESNRVVIETRRLPCGGVVAGLASGGEIR